MDQPRPTALVTGASTGLGRAIALALAAGHDVAATRPDLTGKSLRQGPQHIACERTYSPSLPTQPLVFPATLRRSRGAMALVVGDQDVRAQRNASLVRLTARAHALRDALPTDGSTDLAAVATREGLTRSYLTRLLRLAYLSFRIAQAILDGARPTEVTPSRLMRDTRLPMRWDEQETLLGIA